MRLASKLVSRAVKRIQKKGLLDTAGFALHILSGLADFYLNPFAKKQSRLTKLDYNRIKRDFEARGIEVVPYQIDINEFKAWLSEAKFPEYYSKSYDDVFSEKALEHYVGSKLLDLYKGDVLIDVAASSSPWLEISERMYDCTTYALDLGFPPGINGKKIGADATAMPIPSGFATKMVLHCAYEMFEGDADIRLLPEAYRVLAGGGKMVILPLYMHNFYFADSSPLSDRRDLDYQKAERVWRDDGHRVRFSRKYSVEAFSDRVVNNLTGFKLKIFHIENEKEVSPACYLKFAAVFEK
jgi:hypothetical protein